MNRFCSCNLRTLWIYCRIIADLFLLYEILDKVAFSFAHDVRGGMSQRSVFFSVVRKNKAFIWRDHKTTVSLQAIVLSVFWQVVYGTVFCDEELCACARYDTNALQFHVTVVFLNCTVTVILFAVCTIKSSRLKKRKTFDLCLHVEGHVLHTDGIMRCIFCFYSKTI